MILYFERNWAKLTFDMLMLSIDINPRISNQCGSESITYLKFFQQGGREEQGLMIFQRLIFQQFQSFHLLESRMIDLELLVWDHWESNASLHFQIQSCQTEANPLEWLELYPWCFVVQSHVSHTLELCYGVSGLTMVINHYLSTLLSWISTSRMALIKMPRYVKVVIP